MAPEQLTGKEVTVRSDIYALGLVLYELFTGKRVFEAKSIQELMRLHEKSAPPTPSSHVKDIDPLVERVILRCLEKDPKARPASAIQVAAALPGGDPLQAALAAGETPSPEMVAAAGEKTGLRPAVALSCLIAIIAGLLIAAFLSSKVHLVGRLPLENSPDVLANKARETISRLGYTDRPVDTAYGFNYDGGYLRYAREQGDPATYQSRLRTGRPAVIRFWYRESPQYLEAGLVEGSGRPALVGVVTPGEPPPIISGMASAVLDPQGRLIAFSAVPPQVDGSSGAPPRDSGPAGRRSSRRQALTRRASRPPGRNGRRSPPVMRGQPGRDSIPSSRRSRCASKRLLTADARSIFR
jgi:serine/threonine-protein kinase